MKTTLSLTVCAALALTLASCSETDTNQVAESATATPTETEMTTSPVESNPFFEESPLYMHYPQFDKIENSHFVPAFELGMEQQLAEIRTRYEQGIVRRGDLIARLNDAQEELAALEGPRRG